MKCEAAGCSWTDVPTTSPCSVCGRQVHHMCSNDIYDGAELSKRFCSRECVRRFFSAKSDAQELTPSSASGVSRSSQDVVIDLAQGDPDDGEEPTAEVPAHTRPRNATNWVWDYVHRLEEPVAHNNTMYTHICLLCLQKKSWQDSLCKARHTSNAKGHLVSIHKENEGAMKEKQHRSKRASRFDVAARPREDVKRAAEPSEKTEQPAKRQKKLTWRAPVSRDQISGHIARWLIRDGLPRNMTTTTAFREFLVGVTGEPNVTIPSHKTYNDILDKHYSNFKKDVSKLIAEEFKELFEMQFLNVEHDLWSNSSKSCVVGASCSFIDHHWQPRHIALLAEVKNDGHNSEEVAEVLDKELKDRYGLDVNKMARFTLSDTASAARKVSRQFDSTLQTDCTMHALNLCIGYGMDSRKTCVMNTWLTQRPTFRSRRS